MGRHIDRAGNVESEEDVERRLQREARDVYLGTLGDRTGINVAKVEVSWYWEDATDPDHNWPSGISCIAEEAGHYYVHATGEEEDADTIYDTFERLVHEAMDARQKKLSFHGWEIDDISSA